MTSYQSGDFFSIVVIKTNVEVTERCGDQGVCVCVCVRVCVCGCVSVCVSE